jgi:hypothetical protein
MLFFEGLILGHHRAFSGSFHKMYILKRCQYYGMLGRVSAIDLFPNPWVIGGFGKAYGLPGMRFVWIFVFPSWAFLRII